MKRKRLELGLKRRRILKLGKLSRRLQLSASQTLRVRETKNFQKNATKDSLQHGGVKKFGMYMRDANLAKIEFESEVMQTEEECFEMEREERRGECAKWKVGAGDDKTFGRGAV